MTGYGLSANDFAQVKYTVEIKSLNSKFLELSLKLPRAFSDKELLIRNECSKQIERGKVSFVVTAEYPDKEIKTTSINTGLLKSYYTQLKAVADELGDQASNLFQVALNFPEVIHYEEEAVSDEEWKQLNDTIEAAIKSFQQFRSDEGAVLQKDLEYRINRILGLQKEVEEQEPKRIPLIRERIRLLMQEYVGKENVDHNRFEQELIYYIDKLDITEEKIRLTSHCNYFLSTLKLPDANGKKLGFISQEIGREINTMGSKANDAQIQQLVVGMKEELEKIKEQLLNVL
ncbi:YicC family protein [Pedobacter sp. HMF7056]|uniref:YicC family protein n=2 Tax=Hufsiella ginkgonis TaxID=2695274 RepID=A0A7K1XT78_9SPHI|nr:YicC family protein [Hufsiella ginkgonis]